MEQQPATFEIEQHGDVAVLRLVGEHDLVTKATLGNQLRAVASSGRGLVVSLMETTFLDSSVVHALFVTNGQLNRHGRRLVLHVATASIVERVLTISGLSEAMPCTGSLEEAIELAGRASK
jgi:anti-anti-sigma factor